MSSIEIGALATLALSAMVTAVCLIAVAVMPTHPENDGLGFLYEEEEL